MTQPTNENGVSASWLLIAGVLAGALLLAFMAWDSAPSKKKATPTSADLMTFTSANWQREVAESKVPVLVDFGATWCGPCKTLSPTIDRLATKYKGKVKVGKVDVDEAPELATKFGVSGIPHVLIFDGGEKPSKSFVGLKSEDVYAAAIDGILAQNARR